MATLLEKTRQVNELLQKNNLFDVQAELPYNKMAMILGDILESNAYIISSSGDLLGYTEKLDVNNARIKNMFKEKKFPQGYTEAVDMLKVTEANIPIDSDLTAFPFESRELYPFGLTLSYSELKAVHAIFEALDGEEGRLTASSIADEIGITRSVIVNALRKLESAGIIESRSLGMKGTYLKVLNQQFIKELEK